MANRFFYPFQPVNSSEIAFNTSVAGGTSSVAYALESSARFWQYPTSRSIQIMESSGVEFYIKFGSSTVVANSSDSMKCLGGAERVYGVDTSFSYMAVASSTDVVLNVTLGTGI